MSDANGLQMFQGYHDPAEALDANIAESVFMSFGSSYTDSGEAVRKCFSERREGADPDKAVIILEEHYRSHNEHYGSPQTINHYQLRLLRYLVGLEAIPSEDPLVDQAQEPPSS